MPITIQVTKTEWEDAKAFFIAHPNEIKFRKAKKTSHTHSFLYINHTIYAVNNTKHQYPEPDAGGGGYSRVKFALTKNRAPFIIKIASPTATKAVPKNEALLKKLGHMLSDGLNRTVKKGESGILITGFAQNKRTVVKEETYTLLKYFGDRALLHELLEEPDSTSYFLSQNEKLMLILKAMMSIHSLHQQKIVHGDIKPENFVLEGKNETRVCTAIDLDASIQLHPDQKYACLNNATFTVFYAAPELQYSGVYSFAGDVFSFGIMLQEIGVEKKFYENLIMPSPENRPSLLTCMTQIALHLGQNLSEGKKESLRVEISIALQEFSILLDQINTPALQKPAPSFYLPRKKQEINIPLEHKSNSAPSLNKPFSKLSLRPKKRRGCTIS